MNILFVCTGNIFIKDGEEYHIRNRTAQALRSRLHYPPVDIEKVIAAVSRT